MSDLENAAAINKTLQEKADDKNQQLSEAERRIGILFQVKGGVVRKCIHGKEMHRGKEGQLQQQKIAEQLSERVSPILEQAPTNKKKTLQEKADDKNQLLSEAELGKVSCSTSRVAPCASASTARRSAAAFRARLCRRRSTRRSASASTRASSNASRAPLRASSPWASSHPTDRMWIEQREPVSIPR